MKQLRYIVMTAVLLGMLLASDLFAYAMGFDAEKTYESVFVIYADNSMGSGFAIGKNSIITNAHVVKGAGDIQVISYTGEQVSANLFFADENTDIALLAVADAAYKPIAIADYEQCSIGDDIYTSGAPNSMAYTLTKGVISAKNRQIGTQSYIQIDAAINEGNSGGPLLNDRGEALGVNSMKLSDSEGIGLSIPMNIVCELLKSNGIELDENGNVGEILKAKTPDTQLFYPDTPQREDESGIKSNLNAESKAGPLLAVLLSISVILNLILLSLLLHKRKKVRPITQDPSERTDFEIEFLE